MSAEKYDYAKFTRDEVERVFGPKSNSAEAARMAKFEPQKYAALKQSAAYIHGVVAEAMLPRASQLTREQREAKTRADLAAQKDELIEVPVAMCDRLGLPHGTRVTWENLQKSMGRQPI